MFCVKCEVQQKTLANELFSKKHSDWTEHVGICLLCGVCYTNETHMPITIFLSMVWYCSIKTTIFKAGLRQMSETECVRPAHRVRQPCVPYCSVLTLWNLFKRWVYIGILYCLLSTIWLTSYEIDENASISIDFCMQMWSRIFNWTLQLTEIFQHSFWS